MGERNQHWGSTLDDFLHEEDILHTVKAEAVTRVLMWQLAEKINKQGITKTQMAEKMHTSRSQIDRIFKAKGNVTIETLQRAAALVGCELRLDLVKSEPNLPSKYLQKADFGNPYFGKSPKEQPTTSLNSEAYRPKSTVTDIQDYRARQFNQRSAPQQLQATNSERPDYYQESTKNLLSQASITGRQW